MIRIGTSGYSFADWVGPFYPPGTTRGRMLDHYARHFDTVEINATYYRLPTARTFAGMAARTPPDFRFTVKAPKSATHDRERLLEEAPLFRDAVRPLGDAGKLSGVLFQFPYAFSFGPAAIRHVYQARTAYEGFPLVMEFRHASWNDGGAVSLLEDLDVAFCAVDEPRLPGLMPPVVHATSDVGYVRFHGRNERTWWGKGAGDRYDYLYSETELREWAEKIRALSEKTQTTYVFFNNCHRAQAVEGARRMAGLLNVELSGPVQGQLVT